jgi:AcrR family transcriptional regulator
MAGLRERQKREREARILRAATRLFETRGYEATSMQDVARRARLAVGTLYNYFRSKPELALAIVRRDAGEGLAAADAVGRRPPRDPVAAVTTLVLRAVEPFERHDRALWRELLRAALGDPALAAGVFAADLELVARLTRLLRELQARGDLAPGVDPGRGAIALYSVFITWFLVYVSADDLSLDALAREISSGIELVMRGLATRASGATT